MKKFLKICLWSLAFLATLIVLFYAEENWRGARAWNKTLAELKAKGYPTSIAETIPPPIPDEDNIAAAPIFAELLDASGNSNPEARLNKIKIIYPPKTGTSLSSQKGISSNLNLFTDGTGTAKQAADNLLIQLDKDWNPLLAEVVEALQRQQCRWPLAYQKGSAMPVPNIMAALKLAKVLQLRARCHLELGNSELATNDLLSMYRIARISELPPYIINALVSVTIQNLASSVIWDGCTRNLWQEKDLARLQAAIPINRNLPLLQTCFLYEQASFFSYSAQFYKELRPFSNAEILKQLNLGDDDSGIGKFVLFLLWLRPYGWQNLERVKLAGLVEGIINPDSFTTTKKYHTLEYEANQLKTEPLQVITKPLMALSFSALSSVPQRIFQSEATNNQALLACALERYRIHSGKLPLTLHELIPEYLNKIPNQVVINEPMIYKRFNDQDYLLYSIGWNMKDDGGVISAYDHINQFDWVWASKPELYKKQRESN